MNYGYALVDHHFRDASFRRRNAAVIDLKAELAAQGRLHTVTVEQLAFDLGGFERFTGHHVDQDRGAVVIADMLEKATDPLKNVRYKPHASPNGPADATAKSPNITKKGPRQVSKSALKEPKLLMI